MIINRKFYMSHVTVRKLAKRVLFERSHSHMTKYAFLHDF